MWYINKNMNSLINLGECMHRPVIVVIVFCVFLVMFSTPVESQQTQTKENNEWKFDYDLSRKNKEYVEEFLESADTDDEEAILKALKKVYTSYYSQAGIIGKSIYLYGDKVVKEIFHDFIKNDFMEILPTVLKLTLHKNDDIRYDAIQLLFILDENIPSATLLKFYEDKNPKIKKMLFYKLLNEKDESLIPFYIETLEDDNNAYYVSNTLRGIGKINNSNFVGSFKR